MSGWKGPKNSLFSKEKVLQSQVEPVFSQATDEKALRSSRFHDPKDYIRPSTDAALSPEDGGASQDANREASRLANEALALAIHQMLSGDYEEAILSYAALSERWPETAAMAESQIGAAHFFMGRFEEAILSYKHALRLGADKDMMAENIEEAEAALKASQKD